MKNQTTQTTPEIIRFLIANPTLIVVLGAYVMPASKAIAILLEDKYKPASFQTAQNGDVLHIWKGVVPPTIESVLALGAEKIARKSACIYINYLFYMNGGGRGYTPQAIRKIEDKQYALTMQDVEGYAKGVVAAMTATPDNPTSKYFQKAYREWFSSPVKMPEPQ